MDLANANADCLISGNRYKRKAPVESFGILNSLLVRKWANRVSRLRYQFHPTRLFAAMYREPTVTAKPGEASMSRGMSVGE